MVSPESAGSRKTKKSRKQRPAANAARGLEKTRFIGETHLTIERSESADDGPRANVQLPPRRPVERLHERTQAHLLRRRARPLASHSARAGTFRRAVDAAAGVFLCDHCGQCGASR